MPEPLHLATAAAVCRTITVEGRRANHHTAGVAVEGDREGAGERQLAAGSKREEQKHHRREWRNRKPPWERSLSDWEVEAAIYKREKLRGVEVLCFIA
jgi:hypothetical protein